jgi:hypothetical protein
MAERKRPREWEPEPIVRRTKKAPASEAIKRLLKNPRINLISLDDTAFGKTFYVNEKGKKTRTVYTGVTKAMQKVFTRGVNMENIKKKGRRIPKKRDTNTDHIVGAIKKTAKSPCKSCGTKHGTLVHEQVKKATDYINFTGSKETKDVYWTELTKNMDPCTNKLLRSFTCNKMRPIVGELNIFDEDIGCATGADIILIDENRELVLGELKTGYENTSYGPLDSDKSLPGCLKGIRACPMNLHFLQLLITALILEKKYRTTFEQMVIIRVEPKSGIVYYYNMPPYMLARKEMIYESLLRWNQKRKGIISSEIVRSGYFVKKSIVDV